MIWKLSNQSRYRSLSKHYDLPLFFQPWWLDMVSSDAHWDAAIAEENKILKAVWPYTIEKKIGVHIIRNPLMTPYLGPYFLQEDSNNAAFNKLWNQLPKWDACSVECMPGIELVPAFAAHGFAHQERITHLFDLGLPEDELFMKLSTHRRSNIRRAEKQLEVIDGMPWLSQFHKLHKQTYGRKGKKYPYTEAFFKKLIKTSMQHKAGVLLAAKNTAGKISALFFAGFDSNRMYLLISAANPEAANPGAVSLLTWRAIQHAKSMGLQFFDFEGSMDPGIAEFYRRFGGEKLSYHSFTANRSLLWKLKEKLLG